MSPRERISPTASEHCNTGELVAPVDQLTRFADNVIDRPVYHDLTQPAWLKYDVSEWSSKVHKYKQEVVRNTQRLRLLKEEVDALRKQFASDTKEFEALEIEAEKAVDEFNKSQEKITEETRRRAELLSDVSSLKRHKANLLKAQAQMKEETSHMKVRIGNLQTEVANNKMRHENALGEKEKLNLERDWFFRERILLEATTEKETEEFAMMREELEKLRFAMHHDWLDSKKLDVLGHLRATKMNPSVDNWYTARKRTFARQRTKANLEEGSDK